MKTIDLVLVLCCAALLSGCVSVRVATPLGETPVALAAAEWDGMWVNQQGTLFIKVVDAANGRLQLAWPKDEANRLSLESTEVVLRQSGDWTFASLKMNPEDKLYIWARIKKDEYGIVIWLPDPKKFAGLVREGRLPGKADEKDNVVLGELTPAHMKLITSGEKGILLKWENPLILIRPAFRMPG